MHTLAEIQEAIEKLLPDERARLKEWLDQTDAVDVVRERVRQIRAGEAKLVDGDEVQAEMREFARRSCGE